MQLQTLDLKNDGLDGGRTMARMLFPSRPDLRKIHFVREFVEQEVMSGKADDMAVKLPTWMLRTLLDSPGKDETKSLAAEATKRGTVAGDLLALIYEMQARHVGEPSFGKAVDHYKGFALGRKYGDGEALKYSEQTLRNYFDEFASVAHLWAAFRLNQGPYAYTEDARSVFHSPKDFLTFLGIAKDVGRFAESFIPKRTKPLRPVIDGEILVQIPADVLPVRLHFRDDPA